MNMSEITLIITASALGNLILSKNVVKGLIIMANNPDISRGTNIDLA